MKLFSLMHLSRMMWEFALRNDDLVPKGVQEKRTEVLENTVDRMWVSNAFFWMNTCGVIDQWREKAVLLFVPKKFDFH